MLKTQTTNFLKKYNIKITSSLDEQQLIDEKVISLLLDSIEISSADTVLEVGPGAGNITLRLSQRAGRVYAVEKNSKYIPLLVERTQNSKNLEIVEGDILKIKLPMCNKIVSNMPYRILEAFIHKMQWYKFKAASLIVSSSFSETLLAKINEKNFSKLSYESQLFFNINFIQEIDEDAYYPPPSSKTCIITIKPKKTLDLKENILKELILQRDKKIKNALSEAIIKSYKDLNRTLTKRGSKNIVTNLNLDINLNKKTARMNLNDILKLDKTLETLN